MFSSIKEVAEDPDSLVIILIDEVESIAYARDSVSSQEPSDSLRVVNAGKIICSLYINNMLTLCKNPFSLKYSRNLIN